MWIYMFDRMIMNQIKVSLYFIITIPITLFSKLVPKNKKIWVFGSWSGKTFADNSKYLFLYTNKMHPEIKAIWLTKNENVLDTLRKSGCHAYKTNSLMGFIYSMVAGCIITSNGFEDINRYSIGSAKKFNLWHGSPIKRIGLDAESSDTSKKSNIKILFKKLKKSGLYFLEQEHNSYDAYCASSNASKKNLMSAFNIKKVSITGYPRNDALFSTDWLPEKSGYLKAIKKKVHYKYVLTYLPTFRDYNSNIDLLSDYGFEEEKIQDELERLNAILIIKYHHGHKNVNAKKSRKSNQRIYVLSDSDISDVYPILKETDILLTDLSSILFDYLLLDRPIIFTPFDLKDYIKKDRKLYYDYNSISPGPKAKDWDDTFDMVHKILEKDTWSVQREKINNRFNRYKDNRNSERVYKMISDILNIK